MTLSTSLLCGLALAVCVEGRLMASELPDPFAFADNTRVKTRADWERRRAELLASFLQVEYGHPPAPGDPVTAMDDPASIDPALHIVHLRMGPGGSLILDLYLTLPSGTAPPYPVIVTGDRGWGPLTHQIISDCTGRGYAVAEFDRTQIAPDREVKGNDVKTGGLKALYPDADFGCLAAWAWTYQRVNDYLVTRTDIDKAKLILSGHSRGGKAVLLAGALDTRVALTNPNGSGCGGAGCYRVQGKGSESLRAITKNFPFWFAPHFAEFADKIDQLPIDQHELKALIAPRLLLTTDSLDDIWANPLGTQASFQASKPVFEFLGAANKTGLHFRHGPHAHNEEDFKALLDFADTMLLGKPPAQNFDALPFPQEPLHFQWTTPPRE